MSSYPSTWTQGRLTRLQGAVKESYRKLEVARTTRNENIRQYVTSHYGAGGADDRVPVNFLELAVDIYTYQLSAKAPRVCVTAKSLSLRPVVANFESVMNHLLETQLNLEVSFRQAVKDAMFGLGIMKVGKTPVAAVDIDGNSYSIGQPFADPVSLDDWVHDSTAKRWSQIGFCGDRYVIPYEDMLRAPEFFNPEALDGVRPDERRSTNPTGETRASTISSDTASTDEDWRPTVEVVDLWIPSEGILLTLLSDDDSGKPPLRVMEWQGPRRGPYHLLGFNDVPDNIMPLAPASLLTDLHDLANRLFRKLGRQADRQKTITVVQRGGEQDGQRVVEASDGETIAIDNPQNAQQLQFGGVEGNTLAFLLQVKDLITYMGGNLDTLGGLSPQADTLGQEQMLGANSSKRMASMANRTHSFMRGVVEDVGFYVWTDPFQEYPLDKTIPGTDIVISTTLRPEHRREDFYHMAMDIEPYSMQDQTPAMKLQAMTGLIRELIVPLMPMLQAQGIVLNGRGLLTRAAKYAQIDGLDEIVTFLDPQQMQGQAGGPGYGEQAAPAFTRHVSERVSRPGATRAGKDNALMQAIMTGGRMQGSQMAAIPRPTG